jgi:hypothetical protein
VNGAARSNGHGKETRRLKLVPARFRRSACSCPFRLRDRQVRCPPLPIRAPTLPDTAPAVPTSAPGRSAPRGLCPADRRPAVVTAVHRVERRGPAGCETASGVDEDRNSRSMHPGRCRPPGGGSCALVPGVVRSDTSGETRPARPPRRSATPSAVAPIHAGHRRSGTRRAPAHDEESASARRTSTVRRVSAGRRHGARRARSRGRGEVVHLRRPDDRRLGTHIPVRLSSGFESYSCSVITP